MALTDFLVGHAPAYDSDKDPLAKPFPGETEDLKVHAEVCAMRYGRIMEGQAKSDLAAYDLRAFIVKVVVWAFVAIVGVFKAPELISQLLKVM